MPRTLCPDEADAAFCGRQFGKSANWFRTARPALEARGFPKPKPRITAGGAPRGPMTWVKAEVMAWVEAARDGVPAPANDARPVTTPDPVAEARQKILAAL